MHVSMSKSQFINQIIVAKTKTKKLVRRVNPASTSTFPSQQLHNALPVLWSPNVYRSAVLFEYEKPTPAGESRNSIFATAVPQIKRRKDMIYVVKNKKHNQWECEFHLHLFQA